MAEISVMEVYMTLYYHRWKSPLEIKRDINANRKRNDQPEPKSEYTKEFNGARTTSLLDIYEHLDNLVQKGFVMYRRREASHNLFSRRKSSCREYKLTYDGTKNR